jgi:hypothetical protein
MMYATRNNNFIQLFSSTGVLKQLIESIKPGASVKALCEKGDRFLITETGNVMYTHFVILSLSENIVSMVHYV